MIKKNKLLENWINHLIEKVLFEEPPVAPAKNTGPSPEQATASEDPELGIPGDTEVDDSSGSPGGIDGGSQEDSATEPAMPSGGGLGGGMASIGGGGGMGGMDDSMGTGDDSMNQTGAETEEQPEPEETPLDKFKQDFELLLSTKGEQDQIEKFLKASLQDKTAEERNEYLQAIGKDEIPSVKKAKAELNNFFNYNQKQGTYNRR
jgi:hypothetical protein